MQFQGLFIHKKVVVFYDSGPKFGLYKSGVLFFLYLEILCLRFTQFLSHRDHMNQRNNLGHSILVYLCIQVLFDKIKQK